MAKITIEGHEIEVPAEYANVTEEDIRKSLLELADNFDAVADAAMNAAVFISNMEKAQ